MIQTSNYRQRLALGAIALAAITCPSPLAAQSFAAGGMATPSLPSFEAASNYFHSVSSPEVIATPAVQRGYADPSRGAAPGGYAGVAPDPDPFAGIDPAKFRCCEGNEAGKMCQFDRYLKYPSHLSKKELECVVCLKEPYTVMVPVKEQAEVVLFRCFKTEQPFEYAGCEDGTCFYKKGDKELRRMRPCTITVDLNYEKKVVRYRDVWYHVRCPCE